MTSKKSFSNFNNWFNHLDFALQAEFIEALKTDDVLNFFLAYEVEKEIEIEFKEIFTFIDQNLRQFDETKTAEGLLTQGIEDVRLIADLIGNGKEGLKRYFSARFLRETDDVSFQEMIETVIREVIVEKNYRSIKSLLKHLSYEVHAEDATDSFYTIMNLASSFCVEPLSYEDIEIVMVKDLELSIEKMNIMIEALKANREAMERFFLFLSLKKLNRKINQLEIDW
ncbi:hypothetical protein [Alkalihalobacterium alkalinitrilicum]|uniref:hypothetical protein n=1 Tax=Alkalihalobacterium alkalinitrilicum TaxID=427920 RepID=UPI0009949C19|nr:hypothetical protein [Alkalihalobacterium alkalinitrilicum]